MTNESQTASAADIQRALAAPFPAESIGWKPQSVSGSRALALAYIDARDVMDRLDAVVGVGGWHDDYQMLPDGAVVCRLTVSIAGVEVTKKDIGGESDQKDAHDLHKAAFSDALKRAAVKFGIGRYIYRLDQQWCDYDPQKKQFTSTPRLPAWALPQPRAAAPRVAPPPAVPATPPPASEPPATPEFISPTQVTLLKSQLNGDWCRLDDFLKAQNIQSLETLPLSRFDQAVKAIDHANYIGQLAADTGSTQEAILGHFGAASVFGLTNTQRVTVLGLLRKKQSQQQQQKQQQAQTA
jgi:hypothetical protein